MYKAVQSRKLKLPIILPLRCDLELSLWFCSRNAEILHIGSAEKLSNTMSYEGPGPPGSWCRDKAIRSHFLTISATGSGHQTVLAPKGAAPTGGSKNFSQFISLLRRTGQKQQEEDNERLPTPTTGQEFRGQIWLFISNFHVSLREIMWISSVIKTTTSAGKLITTE